MSVMTLILCISADLALKLSSGTDSILVIGLPPVFVIMLTLVSMGLATQLYNPK